MLTSIVAASYFFAAFAFFFLSLLLLTSWRRRRHGTELAIACVMTTVWAAATALAALRGPALLPLATVTEILRGAAWSLFLLTVLGPLRKDRQRGGSADSIPAAAIGVFYAAMLGATLYLYVEPSFAKGSGGFLTIVVGRVGIAVLNMLLVEQIYRNTMQEARWAIKFACLGIGGLFAFDFYLYSDAMLFRQISAEIWAARGAVDALTVPLIAVSAARNPRWSAAIAVSRTVLFHSVALLGSAIYLLSMAAAGYYLRLFGGTWGTVMQVAFLFGAGILLFAVMFSGSVRAWLKVFISKHFYSYRYDYRDEWLRFTRALADAGPGLNERTVQAIAKLMESRSGALYIRRDEAGCCEAVTHWNMKAKHQAEPLQGALCQYLENKQWVIDLQELEQCPERYDGLVIPTWLAESKDAWLVVPLLLERQLFGFVVLGRSLSRIKLNWEALDLLKIAGTQAASYLAQRETHNALMVARQFESYTRMSTFLVHDLKNLIAQLSLMLANAERHKNNPAFQEDMLETVDLSVQKMKLMLQRLSRGPSTESPGPVMLCDLLRQSVQLKSGGDVKPILRIDAPDIVVLADPSRLERVLGHLIQNAIEATTRNGTVTVRLRRERDSAVVEVQDTGHGMTEEFIRDKLFKPFESTKAAGMGIGAFESRTYIRLLGGEIEVMSVPKVGTTFRATLPLHQREALAAAAA